MKWNTIDDCYLLEPFNFQDTPKKLTQRTLLKYVSSIFDPLGMSSPIQICVRTSLQQIWKGNQHWDRPIALADYPELKNFFEDVPNLSTVHIKRHYFEASKQPVRKELHVFNDASEKAIANVVFLRTVFSDKSVSLSFILGKARVAPIKRMTTPNLELLAATNGAKLAQFIKEERNFSFDTIVYWTDSTTVLSWINSSESRHKIFIANRITIILSTSIVSQWRYVPTDLNPADDGTRGIPVSNFTSESRWLKGPDFLLKNPETWSERSHIAPECPISCFPLHPNDAIVSFQNFSQWTRLLKTVAFCYLLLDKHRRINDRLGVAHLMKAFRWFLLETQRTSLPEEINALRNQNLLRLTHEYFLDLSSLHFLIVSVFFALVSGFPKLNICLWLVTQSFLIRNIRQ